MRSFLAALCLSGLLGMPGAAQHLTLYTEIAPPDQFHGPDGVLTGYVVELVREIQKRVGNRDPIEVVPWVRGYKEAQLRPNVVLFAMAQTAERKKSFKWLGPVRESVYNFYVKADSRTVIKSLEDARQLTLIGVYKEDVRDQYLSQLGFTNLDRSLDETIMFKKLMDGRITAMASSAEGIGQTARAAGFRPEDLRETMSFLRVQIYIAFSLGTPDATIRSWSSALEALKKEGVFEQLFRKYYPDKPLPGPAVIPS